MKKIKKYTIQNSLSIIIIFISIFLVGISFYQYFKDYYGYTPKYYELKEKCLKNKDNETCEMFKLMENPKEKFSKLDAVTLTCEIVQHHAFEYMQLLAPLFIIIITINRIHKEISSGMFKYYLTRMKYKEYIKKMFLSTLKPALLLPVLLIIIFSISCIITGFNFKVDSEVKMIAVYDSWKYKNFILYGVIVCIIQYIMALFYGNIGLVFCKKNKNKLISIFLGYITFFAIDIVIYVVVYALILNKYFGYHSLMRYFNLLGYFSFAGDTNFLGVIAIALILVVFSYFILYIVYKDKEGMVLANEEEIG